MAAVKHLAVQLDAAVGAVGAGTIVRLSRITDGSVAGPDTCADQHLHGTPTITVDGVHTAADPAPTACGFGRIVQTEGGL